jgi:hypothetical protein
MPEPEQKYFSTAVTDEEAEMIEQYAMLTGLPKATAVKMHLRQTLPDLIQTLRDKKNPSSVETANVPNSAKQSQGKSNA